MLTRPMKPEKIHSIAEARLPMWCTPKIDGFRCLKHRGQALSNSFKPIRNNYVRRQVELMCPDGFDGELIIHNGNFNDVQTQLSSAGGEPDFRYLIFDYVTENNLNEPYLKRMNRLADTAIPQFSERVLPCYVETHQELEEYETEVLLAGYEGVILRSANSPYKCGRSTLRENWLIALKRFEDAEGIITGFEPQFHNANEAETNELGLTKRSSCQENQIQLDTLGAFYVKNVIASSELGPTNLGREFKIGTGKGLTAELRKQIWNNRAYYLGKLITYKFQAHNTKDKPRSPVFKGFRSPEDL